MIEAGPAWARLLGPLPELAPLLSRRLPLHALLAALADVGLELAPWGLDCEVHSSSGGGGGEGAEKDEAVERAMCHDVARIRYGWGAGWGGMREKGAVTRYLLNNEAVQPRHGTRPCACESLLATTPARAPSVARSSSLPASGTRSCPPPAAAAASAR